MRHWLIYINPFFRTFDFAIGCAAANIYLAKPQCGNGGFRDTLLEVLAFLVAGGVAIFMNKLRLHNEAFYYMLLPLYTVAWCAVILVVPRERGAISRWLSRKPRLVYLGEISFEIFMIHQLVIRYYRTLAPKLPFLQLGEAAAFVVCLLATVALAAASHKLRAMFLTKCGRKERSNANTV